MCSWHESFFSNIMILFFTIFKHLFILILNGLQSYNVQIDKVVWKNKKMLFK